MKQSENLPTVSLLTHIWFLTRLIPIRVFWKDDRWSVEICDSQIVNVLVHDIHPDSLPKNYCPLTVPIQI